MEHTVPTTDNCAECAANACQDCTRPGGTRLAADNTEYATCCCGRRFLSEPDPAIAQLERDAEIGAERRAAHRPSGDIDPANMGERGRALLDDRDERSRSEWYWAGFQDGRGAGLWQGYLDGVAAVLALDDPAPRVLDVDLVAEQLGLDVGTLAAAIIERRKAKIVGEQQ